MSVRCRHWPRDSAMRGRRCRLVAIAATLALALMGAGGCGPSAEESAERAQEAAAQAKAAAARAQAAAALAQEEAADAQRRADHAVKLFEAAAAEFNDVANRLEKRARERARDDE
jgi:hypothetical protein